MVCVERFGRRVVSCGLAGVVCVGVCSAQVCEPAFVGGASPVGRPKAVWKDGDRLYVASNEGDLQVVSVADPLHPVVVGNGGAQLGFALDVQVAAGFAWVTTYVEDSFQVYRLTNPDAPAQVYRGALPQDGLSVEVHDPAGDGLYAYVGMQTSVQVYDFTTLPQTTIITPAASFGVGTLASDLRVHAGHLYVANGAMGLRVFDISDPVLPVQVALVDTPGFAEGLDIEGDLLYVADGFSGLRVYDIAVASSPALLGVVDTPGIPVKVDVVGSTAYVASSEGDFEVVDVADPTSPALVASLSLSGDTLGVFVDGGFAYLAQDLSKIDVIDIAGCGGACPADLNGDGALSGADFNAWLTAFLAGDSSADQNGDGMLSGADFNAFLSNFAGGCA